MNTPKRYAFREDYARLRHAQKSSKGAPLYSVVVNRPLGRIFAAAAHLLDLTPNQVTLVSALFTFTGIALVALAPPSLTMAICVTLALTLGYALDAADGQLARLRGGGSLTGEWLDHVIDSFKVATLHLAVLISMYRFYDVSSRWFLVPILFTSVYVVHFFGMLLTDLLSRNAKGLFKMRAEASQDGSWMIAFLKLPTDYGLLCVTFLLFAHPPLFQWVYLALALANTAYTVLVLRSWYRRLQELDMRSRSVG